MLACFVGLSLGTGILTHIKFNLIFSLYSQIYSYILNRVLLEWHLLLIILNFFNFISVRKGIIVKFYNFLNWENCA